MAHPGPLAQRGRAMQRLWGGRCWCAQGLTQVFRGHRRNSEEAGLRKARTSRLPAKESGEPKAVLGLGQSLRPPWRHRLSSLEEGRASL